jgi:hypothetical protein
MCLHAMLAHLVPSSTPHTSQLHGLVKTLVNSAVNNKFTGIAINIEKLQVVDRNCWVMEWPKQPHVNRVNIVMCDSTPTTTSMPPKKQPQHDQPRLGPPKPDKKGKGHSDNQDPPSPVASGSQLKEKGRNNQDPQSPVASGSQLKGRAPGAPAYTPGERKAIPAPPKKKTPAEKKREREEAEEAYEASCPDVLFDDLE